MTTPQNQFTDATKRGQEAITTAMRTWAENVQALMAGAAGGQSGLPNPQQIVDKVFDFAEQVLATQRELTKTLLSAGAQATEAATSQAREAAESMTTHAVEATEAVTEEAAQAGQAAGEKVSGTARSGRNTTKG
jgi:hypothetical protein